MPETSLYLAFIIPLNELKLPYMVTRSVASMLYGEPRLTNGVDLVISLPLQSVDALVRAFPAGDFYCPPTEVIALEASRTARGHFNVIHRETGFNADFYLTGRDLFHAWAIERRQQVSVDGVDMWLAPPEYVIVRKLQFFEEGRSEKHLRDIRLMFELAGEQIDHDQLSHWIDRQGLREAFTQNDLRQSDSS